MKSEPALSVGLVTALIQAVVGLAIAFGADVSDEQQQAIILCVSTAFPVIMVMAAVVRQIVYAPDTVKQIRTQSVKAGETGGAAPIVP